MNSEVCTKEQEPAVNLCTYGSPIPDEDMMCNNCVLSAPYSLGLAQAAAYDDGMSAGASDSIQIQTLMQAQQPASKQASK